MKFVISSGERPKCISTDDWAMAQDEKGTQAMAINGVPYLLDAGSFEMLYTLVVTKQLNARHIIRLEGKHIEVWEF